MAKLEKLTEYETRVKEFYDKAEKLVQRARQNTITGVWSQSQIEQLNEMLQMVQLVQYMVDAVVKHNR